MYSSAAAGSPEPTTRSIAAAPPPTPSKNPITGQAASAAARHDRNAVRITPRDHLCDFLGAARQGNGVRVAAEPPRLGLIGQVGGARRNDVGADRSAQVTLDGCEGAHARPRNVSCSRRPPALDRTIASPISDAR